jgi:hypothetical protein
MVGVSKPLRSSAHCADVASRANPIHAAHLHVVGEPPQIGPGERGERGKRSDHDRPIALQHGLDRRL